MATYNPVTKKFSYSAADERQIENTRRLLSAIAEYGADMETKQSATTAYNGLQFVLNHIAKQRAPQA